MDAVERLAPYTINTHLKDGSLGEYRDGLLLVEPVFGEGYFDLPRVVSAVRGARPTARFTVEMLTRDPLKVPVFTDRYGPLFRTAAAAIWPVRLRGSDPRLAAAASGRGRSRP
jgi:hypothetical protein